MPYCTDVRTLRLGCVAHWMRACLATARVECEKRKHQTNVACFQIWPINFVTLSIWKMGFVSRFQSKQTKTESCLMGPCITKSLFSHSQLDVSCCCCCCCWLFATTIILFTALYFILFFKAHNVFFFHLYSSTYSIIFVVNGERASERKKNVECRIEVFFRLLYFISTVNTHTRIPIKYLHSYPFPFFFGWCTWCLCSGRQMSTRCTLYNAHTHARLLPFFAHCLNSTCATFFFSVKGHVYIQFLFYLLFIFNAIIFILFTDQFESTNRNNANRTK